MDSDAKDSAGSKRRHIETVSQVALPTMDSDAKVIAGLKRKHMGIMSQVALPIVGSDAKVIVGSKRRHKEMCVKSHFLHQLVTPRLS